MIFRYPVSVVSLFVLLIGQVVADSPETLLEQAYRLDAGESGPRDLVAAAALYHQAAIADDPYAQLRLGQLHELGEGVAQDYDLARSYYEQAAQADLPEARFRLAMCHLEGWGGSEDRDAFIAELTLAANGDYLPAQRVLAEINFFGFHIPKDVSVGVAWLERAGLLEEAAAQYVVGRASEKLRRLSVETDMRLARDWYELSAEQDYLTSMRAMARTFLQGPTQDHDWELARSWLELADEAGDDEAPYILASYSLRFHAEVAGSESEARAMLERAAERGNLRAEDVLNLAATTHISLQKASLHVISTPYEDRYVQHVAREFAASEDEWNRQPQITRVVTPFFPTSLRMLNREGEAMVSFVVGVKGRVSQVRVVSATHPLFGENAANSVKHWRFIPGKREGRLVNVRMQVPVYFQLREEQLDGVDRLLNAARYYADVIGGQALEDAMDIRWAKPVGKLPVPRLADGSNPGPDAEVVLLLVLDEDGWPQRGHILHSSPSELGATLLEIALRHQFEPRMAEGEVVAGSVVLPFRSLKE